MGTTTCGSGVAEEVVEGGDRTSPMRVRGRTAPGGRIGRAGARTRGYILALRPGISEASILVKPKHLLPRSLREAPIR